MSNDLISRSSLLEELKEQHDYIMQDPEVGKAMKWCEAVCFNRTVETVKSAPAVDAGPKWISVKEKLPERNKRVLVAFKDGMVTTSMRTLEQHTGVFGFLFEGDYGTATHWMPLPGPPKEG